MKRVISILFLISIQWAAQAQTDWAIKAGFGTSWVAFSKVFLQDPNDANNTWEIAPATNSVTFYLGGEVLLAINDHLGFRGELSYYYVSGEVNVSEIITSQQARKLQAYHRLEVPILFSVKSDDSFWFSIGSSVFFTLADNKGLEEAIHELALDTPIDSSVPIGIKARIAANMKLTNHLSLEIKFDYDLGKHFNYEDNVYDIKMAMQGITGGLTYVF